MIVKGTKATSRTLSTELDLFSDGPVLTKEQKDQAREQIGEFLKEQILSSIGELSSPVSGQPWPKLSHEYAKLKAAEGLRPVADLDVSGEMLGELDYKDTAKGIELGIFGSAALRADGHNNFSGESQIPTRRFLPDEGESFKGEIENEVDSIINDIFTQGLDVTRSELADITSKDELWSFLIDLMPDFSNAEIVDAISRSEELSTLLDEFDLLKWLEQE